MHCIITFALAHCCHNKISSESNSLARHWCIVLKISFLRLRQYFFCDEKRNALKLMATSYIEKHFCIPVVG